MKKQIDVKKAAIFAIIINSVQILAVLLLSGYVIFDRWIPAFDEITVEVFVSLAALVVIIGAIMDIREALAAGKVRDKLDAMDTSYEQIQSLNGALRAQRHDFLNHLQVVYSLMEMDENRDAMDYIEKVYGDIQSLSRDMRTGNPAVNALLRVKLAMCKQAGIQTETKITGAWTSLPMPSWAFCRVLGNLIDNARDALLNTKDKRVRVEMHEDLHSFTFSVSNSGPEITKDKRARIFEPGFSTKGTERGMGLAIVHDTLAEYGGEITLESNEAHTTFQGSIPKAPQATQKE